MSDTLFTFLLLLTTYLLFVFEHRDVRTALIAGLLLGFASLVRSGGAYLILILSVFTLWDVIRRVGYRTAFVSVLLLIVGYGVVLAPWYVRNYRVGDGAIGISPVGSSVLLFNDVREFLVLKTGMSGPDIDKEIASKLPIQDVAELYSNIKYSKDVTRVAIEYISENPIQYGLFHLAGSANLFLSSSFRDLVLNLPRLQLVLRDWGLMDSSGVSIKTLLRENPLAAVSASVFNEPLFTSERLFRVGIVLLAFLGCISVFSTPQRRLLFLLCAGISLYFALVIGPVSYPRYRIPAEPFLFLAAGAGVVLLPWKLRGTSDKLRKT